jgi:Protein of unknown function (DUF3126)
VDVQEVRKLDAYLKRLFGNPQVKVVPKESDVADVYIGEQPVANLSVDDEDGDRSFQFEMAIKNADVQDLRKLDGHLKGVFGNAKIRVVARPKKDDSAEVYIGDQFVGVLFDDGGRSVFQMAILEDDLLEQEQD